AGASQWPERGRTGPVTSATRTSASRADRRVPAFARTGENGYNRRPTGRRADHGGSAMPDTHTEPRRNKSEDDITAEALARFAETPDPRLRQIMLSLIGHLHAFVKEVQLTEAEWFQAIGILTE